MWESSTSDIEAAAAGFRYEQSRQLSQTAESLHGKRLQQWAQPSPLFRTYLCRQLRSTLLLRGILILYCHTSI